MSKRKSKAPVRGAAPMQVNARYDAGGMGRRMRGWTPPSSGPNVALEGLQNIRNRSHDVVRNDWSGRASIQKWSTSLVGTGIVPRVKGAVGKARKLKLAKLWNEWVKVSDADGVLNFYGQETLATKSWLEAGEVFGRLRTRTMDLGLPVPLQVQLLEAEYVPLLDTDAWPGLPTGNRIRSGIELDKRGRRVAYWMYRAHPGDKNNGIDIMPHMLLRIPADEVIHMYEPERPGQLRGVSTLSAILTRLRGINDFDDAVLERQKIANLFTLFITRPKADGDENVDPVTGKPYEMDADGAIATLMPGTSQVLNPGEEAQFANPPEAGTTYSDYIRTQHLGTASGGGLPYELLTGDIMNVSDRTLRVLINEFRRFAEQRQWQIIIPMFCDRVRTRWAEEGFFAGLLDEADFEAARDTEWSPHGWQYLHPVQDVQGKALEISTGLRARSSVIGERGDDADEVDEQRAADKAREKELDLVAPAPAVKPAKPDPGAKPPAKPQ